MTLKGIQYNTAVFIQRFIEHLKYNVQEIRILIHISGASDYKVHCQFLGKLKAFWCILQCGKYGICDLEFQSLFKCNPDGLLLVRPPLGRTLEGSSRHICLTVLQFRVRIPARSWWSLHVLPVYCLPALVASLFTCVLWLVGDSSEDKRYWWSWSDAFTF